MDAPSIYSLANFVRAVPDGAVLTVESSVLNVLPVNMMGIAMACMCAAAPRTTSGTSAARPRWAMVAQIEQLVRIAGEFGRPIATAQQAREICRIGRSGSSKPALPGGTIDVFARIISDQLAQEIRQPVIVENRPAPVCAIAVAGMLSQPADGSTLLVTVTNILTEVPHVLKKGPPGHGACVAFPGSAPALAQVMGNQIPLMFDGSVTSKPLIAGGKVRLLAVAYKSRLPDYPQVPTLAELGYPGVDFSNWSGVRLAQTPRPLLEKIHGALARVNARKAVRERYAGTGFEPVEGDRSLEQMSTDLRTEFDRNAEIVRNFDIRLN
ncbi:WD repeat-containing protein 27 [Manis javanica]|nr:WD repeat-containing protein 27 [Manis javanica]